jgi:hypothetical protein
MWNVEHLLFLFHQSKKLPFGFAAIAAVDISAAVASSSTPSLLQFRIARVEGLDFSVVNAVAVDQSVP